MAGTRLKPNRGRLRNVGRDVKETASFVGSQIRDPSMFQRFKPDRGGQILALFFVGPIIVVSLVIVVVLNQLATDVLLNGAPLAQNQQSIAGFLVTAITAGAFIFMAWTWFQFVKTSGFGLFYMGED